MTSYLPSVSTFKKKLALVTVFYILASILLPAFINRAFAADLTEAVVRLDRMGESLQFNTTTGYRILVLVKPTTVGSIGKVRLTFPTSNAFTVNGTATNFDTTTTGLPTTFQGESVTAATVTNSEASAVSGGDVTFDVTSMSSASTLYGFFITCSSTTCITNPASGDAGTHNITVATLTSGSSVIDSKQVAVDTLSSATGDQVTVTASVPSTFNFAIADATIALGTLSTGSVSTNAMSSGIDVDTNAGNGYAAWIRSEGAAATLASASTGDAISSTNTGSPVTCSSGSECYVVDAAVTGTGTPTTEYDGNGTTSGGVISTTYEEMVNATAPVANDSIVLTAIVAISGLNEAASDYTDTWEIVGAGNF